MFLGESILKELVLKKVLEANTDNYAVFHTLYKDSNKFFPFDCNEIVDNFMECVPENSAYFMYDNSNLIGGFTLNENTINFPFMVTPFNDRNEFWKVVLEFAVHKSMNKEITLNRISEIDSNELVNSYNAILKYSIRRMYRPTEQFTIILNENFYFDEMEEKDKAEITKIIFEAHSSGYTSTAWELEENESDNEIKNEIEQDVEKWFASFKNKNSLFMINIVKSKNDNKIAGVCITGIYPNSLEYSTANFATIHEISVKPIYQRNGIAKAMMLKAISEASVISPIITLGVLIGNPSEILYKKLGFLPGSSYSELIYKNS